MNLANPFGGFKSQRNVAYTQNYMGRYSDMRPIDIARTGELEYNIYDICIVYICLHI